MIDLTNPTLDTTTADEVPEEPSGLAAFVRARIQATAEQPELPAEDSVDEPADDECSEDVPDSGEDEPAERGMSRDLEHEVDAQWLHDNWNDLADDEQLEVSVGGMRLFLSQRLAEALGTPAPSDHEDNE